MSKLFIRLRDPDEVAEEAMKKVADSLSTTESATDVNNNPSNEYLVVDDMVFGKPVVLKETSSATEIEEENVVGKSEKSEELGSNRIQLKGRNCPNQLQMEEVE